MRGRTVILVSHHVQLCSPGAAYVVALDNGRLQWSGSGQDFAGSAVMESLVQSKAAAVEDADDPEGIADDKEPGADSETTSVVTAVGTSGIKKDDGKTKAPRKLIEEEKRAVGRVGKNVWLTYLRACGALPYWSVFVLAHVIGSLTQVVENAWLRLVTLGQTLVIY
jgi:ABC-type multidrug transport system ATPase subunit